MWHKNNIFTSNYKIKQPFSNRTDKHRTHIKMTLIKSISGIRGTIGGTQGDNLTPIDIVKFTTA